MRRCRRLVLLVSILAAVPGAAPAWAAAGRAEALRDLAPTGDAVVHDRVLLRPVAAAAVSFRRYGTGRTGEGVRVAVSRRYGRSAGVARSYARFLGSLPHGAELSRLRVYIAPRAEVRERCGGWAAVVACYSPSAGVIVVPGQRRLPGGLTTSYIVAHEYGHHIAANRSNSPFPTVAYGPKYWASNRLVCRLARTGGVAPGNEGGAYAANPAEAWAETYAWLRYPRVRWPFTRLLAPTPSALAAARRDVLSPWTRGRTVTYAGVLGPGRAARSFPVRLTLDGSARIALRGPRGADFDLRLSSGGRTLTATRTPGSADRIAPPGAVCRDAPAEWVTVTVQRRSGAGRFALTVAYPG